MHIAPPLTRASDTVIRNTLFNAGGRAWGVLVSLLLTPYILNNLGVERFGVWAVVGVLAGYFGLMDLGVSSAFIRYIAFYHAKGDFRKAGEVVSTGAAFYAVFGVVLVLLAWVSEPLLALFNFPAALHAEALFALRGGMLLLALSGISAVYGSVQGGVQRMDISNWIAAGGTVPLVLATVFLLENGWGLRGVVLANALSAALIFAANVAAARRLLPGADLSPSGASAAMFRELFGFGVKLQFSRFADAVAFQADRLLLAHYLGAGAAGVYQLGSSAAGQLRSLPLMLVSAMLPAASGLQAKGETARLKQVYLKGTRYLALTGLPLFIFAAVTAGLLVEAWVGPGYTQAALVLRILAAGYLVNLVAGSGTLVAAAIGAPGLQARAGLISAVSNVTLGILLVTWAGLPGLAAAVSLSLLLGPLYFFWKLGGRLELPASALLRELLSPLGTVLPAAALLVGLNLLLFPAVTGGGRAACLAALALESVCFFSLYSREVRKRGLLDAEDRELFSRALLRLRNPGAGAC